MLRKKLLFVATMLIAAVLAFGACGNGNGDDTPDEVTPPEQNVTDDTQANDTQADDTQAEDPPAANGMTGRVTIGTGENPVMLTALMEVFNQRHPGIEVDVMHTGEWMGNETMARIVAAGEMPCIIFLQNPQFPVQNNWVIDLQPFVDNTPDFDVPEAFTYQLTLGDELIGVPWLVFMHGVVVNLSLLDAENIPRPDYFWTLEDMEYIIRRGTRHGESIGINNVADFLKHVPPQMNHNLGWSGFNHTARRYELGDDWVRAATIAADLVQGGFTLGEQLAEIGNYWYLEEGSPERAASQEARQALLWDLLGLETDWHALMTGQFATWMDFSWGMNFHTNELFTGFEWDFFPFPAYNRGDTPRPGIVVDPIGITTAAPYPEAAWEVVRFLTFDHEGLNARYDIIDNWDQAEAMERWPGWAEHLYPENMYTTSIPPTTNTAIIDRWVAMNDASPGLRFIMGNMGIGYMDGFKVTPGYEQAFYRTISDTWRAEVMTGQRTAADIVGEVESIANDIIRDSFESIGIMVP